MIHEWDSSQEPARKEEDFDMVIRRFKDEDAQGLYRLEKFRTKQQY